jgi:hypothetical protein
MQADRIACAVTSHPAVDDEDARQRREGRKKREEESDESAHDFVVGDSRRAWLQGNSGRGGTDRVELEKGAETETTLGCIVVMEKK